MSIKMWTTKYCIGEGKVREVELRAEPNGDGYAYEEGRWTSYKLGRDLFASEKEARAAALVAASKKIASLQKQISKLEAMRF